MRSRFARELVLDGVITLVDCENFDDNLAHATVAYQQLVGADLLVLTKVDLAGRETAELLRSRLATLNRRAGIVISDRSALPLDLLLGIGRAPNGYPTQPRRGAPHGIVGRTVQSVSLDVDRPLDQRRFSAWVESLAPDVFRAKGLVRFGSDPRPYVFHQVGVRQDLAPAPQAAGRQLAHRGGLLVVFGVGLDMPALSAGLRACTTT
jgi:G3E family GTPase